MWLRAENRDDRKDCQRARFKFEKLAHVQTCMMEFAGASMRRRRLRDHKRYLNWVIAATTISFICECVEGKLILNSLQFVRRDT